uniref:No apical meristem-associated C-terminal domain-containing protein n=1 Tax=Tanacetum cinerariifolium TaxID=118510 RepID=A0A6L2N6F8_TANCI|nr:hypothetical protein [Tanacetum cinerariifolium]
MLRNPSSDLNLLRRQSYYHQPYPNQPYRNPTRAPKQYGFYGYGSHPNAFQDYTSQHSSFPFSHQDYVSQTQMGGPSSQPRTYPPKSPINAFPIEELYTPEFLESLQENIDYWQAPSTYEAAGWLAIFENSKDGYVKKKQGFWREVLEYIKSKTKQYGRQTYKAVLGKWKTMRSSVIRFSGIYSNVMHMVQEIGAGAEYYVQKAMIHYEVETGIPFKLRHCWEVLRDRPKWQEIALPKFSTGSGGSKRHKSSGSSSFNIESGEASINLNTNVGDNNEDEVQKIRRPNGRDKARAAWRKNKRLKPTGSSTLNEDETDRVDGNWDDSFGEEEHLAFLKIKRRDVECREQEIEQQDMRFYLHPYDHLTGDQQNAMEEIRAKIKAKYNL